MDEKGIPRTILVTARQRAILRVLQDAGMTEGGEYPDGRRFEDGPPEGMAMMVDFALDAAASEEDILGILAWGNRELYDAFRPIARSIIAIRDSDAPPA